VLCIFKIGSCKLLAQADLEPRSFWSLPPKQLGLQREPPVPGRNLIFQPVLLSFSSKLSWCSQVNLNYVCCLISCKYVRTEIRWKERGKGGGKLRWRRENSKKPICEYIWFDTFYLIS
jgi:hypothetical protein